MTLEVLMHPSMKSMKMPKRLYRYNLFQDFDMKKGRSFWKWLILTRPSADETSSADYFSSDSGDGSL